MTQTRHTLVTTVALAAAAVTLLVLGTGSAGASPSTGSLVFTSPMDGMSDIYVLQGDGKTVNLTHDPDVRTDVQPHWSPDGSQILFTRYLKNGNASVMRVNADGQKLINLTPNFARSQSIDPNWSTDGSEIVFASNQDGNFDLYTMTANGQKVAPLTRTRSPLANIEPDWAPSGKGIVFSRQGTVKASPATSRLYVIDSSRNVTQLTSAKRLEGDRGPVWSPDSNQIAFSSDRAGSHDLYVLDPRLSVGSTRITWSGKAAETDPTWADDGTSLVFVSTATGATEFWALNLKSLAPSAERQLTFDGQYKSHPDWKASVAEVSPLVPVFGKK